MRLTTIFINSVVIVSSFMVYSPVTYAHVGIGEYAGTHVVAFVPEPRSPLAGEEVQMMFYLRDLHGYFANEPFIASVVIQEVLSDDSERGIFATAPEIIDKGIYTTSYRFTHPGLYRVEFGFSRPNEPDIVRDTVFDIGVREAQGGISYPLVLTIFLPVAALVFLQGFMLAWYRYRRRVRNTIEQKKEDGIA